MEDRGRLHRRHHHGIQLYLWDNENPTEEFYVRYRICKNTIILFAWNDASSTGHTASTIL